MLKLKLHSMIDVITNSSTEIFIYAEDGAVENAYAMLNEILKIANSDKKAEDLFDVWLGEIEEGCDCRGDRDLYIQAKDKTVSREEIVSWFQSFFDMRAEFNG